MLIGDPASDDWPLAIAEYRAVAAEQASDVLQDEVYGPCESGSARQRSCTRQKSGKWSCSA